MNREPASQAGAADNGGPTNDRMLDLVWRRHRQWSLAASTARRRVDRSRLGNLLLLVVGALAGALAAQTWLADAAAKGFAIAAAVALALAGFIQANALNAEQLGRWTEARAASETLKAEVYRYLIRVSPYAGADRAAALEAQLDVVQGRVSDALLADQQTVTPDSKKVPPIRTFAAYVTDRAEQQAEWHRKGTRDHRRQANVLRRWQLAATAAGAVVSAIANLDPAWRLSAWTAAATTIAAVIGTHLAAERHLQIAAAYADAADRLDRLIAGMEPSTATRAQQAQFVADVERVLLALVQGWTDLLTAKPAGPRSQQPPTDKEPAPDETDSEAHD